MTVFTGVVKNVRQETKVAKSGKPYTHHYVVLATPAEGDIELNAGFRNPYTVGEEISVNAEVKFGSLQIIPPGAPSGGGGAPAPARGRGYERTFPVAIDSPEMSIIRQSSLKAAVELMQYIEQTANPMTTDDAVEQAIRIAYVLTEFASGQREAKAARGE
jgi:hypothetical protein